MDGKPEPRSKHGLVQHFFAIGGDLVRDMLELLCEAAPRNQVPSRGCTG